MAIGVTRRRFVTAGTTVAACAMLPPLAIGAAGAAAGEELTSTRFRGHLDTRFTARPMSAEGAAPLTLWLRSVRPLSRNAPGLAPEVAQERSFELVFGNDGPAVQQDTYEIVHPELGTFAALLVPSRDGKKLSAVFNRMP